MESVGEVKTQGVWEGLAEIMGTLLFLSGREKLRSVLEADEVMGVDMHGWRVESSHLMV